MPWLCRLPGAQQLDSAAFVPLAQEAVLRGHFAITANLLELPAAAQLSIDALVRLLESALTCYGDDCMRQLLAHPMAAQLSSDMLSQLLQAACARGRDKPTALLCQFRDLRAGVGT
jgi:hypothetical protein